MPNEGGSKDTFGPLNTEITLCFSLPTALFWLLEYCAQIIELSCYYACSFPSLNRGKHLALFIQCIMMLQFLNISENGRSKMGKRTLSSLPFPPHKQSKNTSTCGVTLTENWRLEKFWDILILTSKAQSRTSLLQPRLSRNIHKESSKEEKWSCWDIHH